MCVVYSKYTSEVEMASRIAPLQRGTVGLSTPSTTTSLT
jgi:hypothetical protein